SGSWVTDLFAVGQTVTVSGTAGHNGTFTIAGVSATTLTLTASTSGADEGPVSATFSQASGDRIIRASGSWVKDGFTNGQTINVSGSVGSNGGFTIASVTDSTLTLTSVNAVANHGAEFPTISSGSGDRLFRANGDWTADGFAVGDTITLSGTASHNGSFTVSGVSASTLTLSTGTTGTDDGPKTVTVIDGGDTITRQSGNWINDGFAVGQKITVGAFPN